MSRGGVPVVALLMGNLSFLKVSAKPIEGASVSSEFLRWRPAGILTLPTWITPLKNVPVVIIKFLPFIFSPYLLITALILFD